MDAGRLDPDRKSHSSSTGATTEKFIRQVLLLLCCLHHVFGIHTHRRNGVVTVNISEAGRHALKDKGDGWMGELRPAMQSARKSPGAMDRAHRARRGVTGSQ